MKIFIFLVKIKMTDFKFDENVGRDSRYGNNPMDNLLAGEMNQQMPTIQESRTMNNAHERQESQQQENFQNEKQYQRLQQQDLVNVTDQNTMANSKNIGYDPNEYTIVDDNQLSSVNDVNLFVRIMLGLILFFQIFIIFRLFAQNQNS